MDVGQMKTVTAGGAPTPAGAYSHAVVVGDFIFTAGQGPFSAATGSAVGESVAEQTRATLQNLAAVLEEVGSSLGHVVKTTVHLADLTDFSEFDAAYREVFQNHLPARTTVQSGLPGIKVEIDCVAVLSGEL